MTEPVFAGFEQDGRRFALLQNGGEMQGIDVSHHQDPGAYDLTGQHFLIARAAYGVRPDTTFAAHVEVARQRGIRFVGGYQFFRQGQPRKDQLAAFVRTLESANALAIAPSLDLEWNNAYDGPPEPDLHNIDGRWLVEELAKLYGQCQVYMPVAFWTLLGKPSWVLDHPVWWSHYTKPGHPKLPVDAEVGAAQWAIHQYQGSPLDRNVARYLPLTNRDVKP